jgi:peptidoglycan-N-acetylglucosamine deacetylase
MLHKTQPLNHKLIIIFTATLLCIVFMFGTIIFITQNVNPLSRNQTPNVPQSSSIPEITQTTGFLPASATPFLSNTPTAIFTPLPPEWSPLPPITDSYPGLITNGDRSEYKISLTFDVCQAEGDLAGYDSEIIRVLNETQTPATFFLGGEWMRDHQAETLELASNPLFELGNHSWSHLDLSSLTPDEMKQEILLAQQYMYNLLGYQTNLFRLPYGTYNEDTLKVLRENGLYAIQWDNVSGDPDPNIDAERMTDWVLQQVQPGSIIIMHANGRGWHTAEALPAIIKSIRQQGYILVTISELLNIQPYK